MNAVIGASLLAMRLCSIGRVLACRMNLIPAPAQGSREQWEGVCA